MRFRKISAVAWYEFCRGPRLPEQIAVALATKVRTSDAAVLDADAFVDAETSLMKLADVIAANYFTSRERSEAPWETFA